MPKKEWMTTFSCKKSHIVNVDMPGGYWAYCGANPYGEWVKDDGKKEKCIACLNHEEKWNK